MSSDPPLDTLTEALRRARSLRQRSVRRRAGQALVEGPQSVRELLAHHPGAARALYLTPAADARHRELRRLAEAGRVQATLVTEDVARRISDDAQGVVAVLRTDRGPAAHRADTLDLGGARLVALLARAADPGNAGTVIRAADAAGADAVILGEGSVEHTSPKVLRSTAGSFFHLPVAPVPGTGGLAAATERLRGAGLQVLAADARGELDLDDLLDDAEAAACGTGTDTAARTGGAPRLARPTAWLFGNEAQGLAEDELALADAAVRVPIHGAAESLNLSVAAALCLYASARAQRRRSNR